VLWLIASYAILFGTIQILLAFEARSFVKPLDLSRSSGSAAARWLRSVSCDRSLRSLRPMPQLDRPSSSLETWTKVIYALHAFSLLTGILGAATVVGAFLTGWPSIIAVILNYVKRSEARGTWLESHFRWQIRTFWFGLLWIVLCGLFVVATLGIGILIAWLPIGVVGPVVHLPDCPRLDGAQRRPPDVCVTSPS
jgi:uncharacterized membrane protein